MDFEAVHTNQEYMYSIGINRETGDYVMAAATGGIAVSIEFFRLTADEFKNYPANESQMTQLAYHCARGERPERKIKASGS